MWNNGQVRTSSANTCNTAKRPKPTIPGMAPAPPIPPAVETSRSPMLPSQLFSLQLQRSPCSELAVRKIHRLDAPRKTASLAFPDELDAIVLALEAR